MRLLEVQTVSKTTATIALDESIAQKVDQYALFINAPPMKLCRRPWITCFPRTRTSFRSLSLQTEKAGTSTPHP